MWLGCLEEQLSKSDIPHSTSEGGLSSSPSVQVMQKSSPYFYAFSLVFFYTNLLLKNTQLMHSFLHH